MIARLTTLFGALALLLATIASTVSTAYTVVRRTCRNLAFAWPRRRSRRRDSPLSCAGAARNRPGSAIGIRALLCVRFVKNSTL